MTDAPDFTEMAQMMGKAQQAWMKAWAEQFSESAKAPGLGAVPPEAADADPMEWMQAGAQAWAKGLDAWRDMLADYEAAVTRILQAGLALHTAIGGSTPVTAPVTSPGSVCDINS